MAPATVTDVDPTTHPTPDPDAGHPEQQSLSTGCEGPGTWTSDRRLSTLAIGFTPILSCRTDPPGTGPRRPAAARTKGDLRMCTPGHAGIPRTPSKRSDVRSQPKKPKPSPQWAQICRTGIRTPTANCERPANVRSAPSGHPGAPSAGQPSKPCHVSSKIAHGGPSAPPRCPHPRAAVPPMRLEVVPARPPQVRRGEQSDALATRGVVDQSNASPHSTPSRVSALRPLAGRSLQFHFTPSPEASHLQAADQLRPKCPPSPKSASHACPDRGNSGEPVQLRRS